MKHYLTEKQFYQLWNIKFDMLTMYSPVDRKVWWTNNMFDCYHLTYTEHNHDPAYQGYWGMIEGDEKYINWFLLNL